MELTLGVKAEGKSLGELATPLSAEHAGIPTQPGAGAPAPVTGGAPG
ncbi:hypothetical protein [Micromonospora fulviviridis]|uniref:Uncharacterized protein n=1 Tax=Micromonospora fulviviridis TaxID=47860 RepID=A0ABV2VEE1_9ACTN